MKVNPVYKKELKIRFRSVKMALIIFAYNLILAFIGVVAFYLAFQGQGDGTVDYSDVLKIYLAIAVIEIGLILFFIPAFSAGAITGERERQTLDILLTTKIKPIQLIMGKLESSVSVIMLLIISGLPIISIVFAVGGIRFKDLLQLIFMALVTAVFIGSIGIFFSCLFKRTVMATVFTYGAVIALTVGTLIIVLCVFLIGNMNLQNGYSQAGNAPSFDVGYLLMIFLINPAVTLISMFTEQYGSEIYLKNLLANFGNTNPFLLKHWFLLSILTQLLLSLIFIVGGAKLLDPMKRRK